MNLRVLALFAVALCPGWATAASPRGFRRRPARHGRSRSAAVDFKLANDAGLRPALSRGSSGVAVLRAQVLLDRAHFSVGEIDASFGENSSRAAAAFNESRGIARKESVSNETWSDLDHDRSPVVESYTIDSQDVAGPFFPIPEDMMERAKLSALPYSSPLEALAEKFHASPDLLRRMNPRSTFQRAGEAILVPASKRSELPKAASVRVLAGDHSVEALDADGKVLARYPASVGSEHDPLPIGQWKINGIGKNPVFHYNPDLFWDADAADQKTTLPAGPNNPVGVVWIDLSKPHYGLHGTAEPASIGKGQTHGCIRLTNWDALELSRSVSPGTPAILDP
ncbi:MAG: L,D-transpeptidase [Thermoanaerobaculia bacterium]